MTICLFRVKMLRKEKSDEMRNREPRKNRLDVSVGRQKILKRKQKRALG